MVWKNEHSPRNSLFRGTTGRIPRMTHFWGSQELGSSQPTPKLDSWSPVTFLCVRNKHPFSNEDLFSRTGCLSPQETSLGPCIFRKMLHWCVTICILFVCMCVLCVHILKPVPSKEKQEASLVVNTWYEIFYFKHQKYLKRFIFTWSLSVWNGMILSLFLYILVLQLMKFYFCISVQSQFHSFLEAV